MGTLKPQSNGPLQQHGDWYTSAVATWVAWYSKEETGRAARPNVTSPLLAVPTASVPTLYYAMWHYN